MSSAEIREKLTNELRLDLIGPSPRDDQALRDEILPDPPSRWYLTGFLVPLGAPPRQKAPDPQEEMDAVEEGGADDDGTPERGPSRPRFLPSSMGLSVLVEPGTEMLRVAARWGDYRRDDAEEEEDGKGKTPPQWRRTQREAVVDVPLQGRTPIPLADTDGLEIARQIRETQIRDETGDRKVLAVSSVPGQPPRAASGTDLRGRGRRVSGGDRGREPDTDRRALLISPGILARISTPASPTCITATWPIGRSGQRVGRGRCRGWRLPGHTHLLAALWRSCRASSPARSKTFKLGMEALAGLADGEAAQAALDRPAGPISRLDRAAARRSGGAVAAPPRSRRSLCSAKHSARPRVSRTGSRCSPTRASSTPSG